MPRVLGGVLGGWAFSYGRGTPVVNQTMSPGAGLDANTYKEHSDKYQGVTHIAVD